MDPVYFWCGVPINGDILVDRFLSERVNKPIFIKYNDSVLFSDVFYSFVRYNNF